ncbi:MAG: ABC transporter ATP-binding protein [Clostridiales bacterium]|nr:ABC transporter ATP-binding protein [Clostridiales bacterium]
MKSILRIYIPFFPIIITTGGLIILQAMLQLELPKFMAQIINEGIVKQNQSVIYETGILMLLLSFLVATIAITVSFLASNISAKGAARLRASIFSKVSSFDSGEMELFTTASLITRATNDVLQVQNASLMILRMGFFAPAMGIGALIMAIRTSHDLTWTIVITLVSLLFFVFLSVALSMPKFRMLQKLMDRINLIISERLKGMLVIRAFLREKREEERFEEANKALMNTNLFVNRLMSLMMPVMSLIMSYGSVLIVYAGSKLIDVNKLAVGDMMAFIQYATHVVMSFLFLTMFFIMLPRAMVSAQRINEVLKMDLMITDLPEPEQNHLPLDTKGEVRFEKASFRYPDAEENVLSNISFKASPNTFTAIVGGTGSGKSTLVNLLPRFHDLTGGKILIDGVDIKTLSRNYLRDLISFVPQKNLLMKGTVLSNVTYTATSIDSHKLEEAITISQSKEFVDQKAEGVESPINQGGTNVSGGQRQRLSIARALYKDAPIYIFDDSFSALDFQTEAALREAFIKAKKGKTVFVVAQRISTVKNANQIIVLDEGKISGIGTHKELLKTCSVYRELVSSQLEGEGGEADGRS